LPAVEGSAEDLQLEGSLSSDQKVLFSFSREKQERRRRTFRPFFPAPKVEMDEMRLGNLFPLAIFFALICQK